MDDQVLSVTELREFVNQTLSYAYPLVVVEGEISGFRINQGKWVFFDLKDSETTISCFMTKYQLKTVLEDGMLVRVAATPNLTKWGKFSLTVKEVELAGAGEVMRAYELLKAQFEKEGLFDVARKRSLPEYPQKIGLITSRDAAAYNDFVTIAQDRWPLADIRHIHVHVQGMQAPVDVVSALRQLNCDDTDLEAIVLIRGGGSAEDLQAFNHEDVVRAVYASHIPVVVGIGHEDDVSLAELVADVRASTPTDAARRLLPDRREVTRHLQRLQDRGGMAMDKILEQIDRVINQFSQQQSRLTGRLFDRISWQETRIRMAIEKSIEKLHHRVLLASQTLTGINPERILAQGYAIVRQSSQVIHDPEELRPDEPILVQLHKGTVQLMVDDKEIADDEDQTSLKFS
ncbi:exodeoxyribonuclease VII large subunit [bacterium]|nr:MAG: exodeoxyribonuclease VII large subunit [bacterium]